MRGISLLLGLGLATLMSAQALAGEVSAAVAANFTKPAEELGKAFTARTGDTVTFSFGATGQLYTQISQAAPFEVFLAADNKRPKQAVAEGFAVDGTVYTYAVGKVVLYSPTIDVTDGEAVLRASAFQHLSVADPKTAPYGAAGFEVLEKLGLTDVISTRIVTGENISQALQFIVSGNAELGFVALSQVIDKPAAQVWRVPAELYTPILQDAVLTRAGENNPAAKAFLAFLRSDEGRAIIEKYGYEAGSGD
jgi:molybdate transport system substrate-binding protein